MVESESLVDERSNQAKVLRLTGVKPSEKEAQVDRSLTWRERHRLTKV